MRLFLSPPTRTWRLCCCSGSWSSTASWSPLWPRAPCPWSARAFRASPSRSLLSSPTAADSRSWCRCRRSAWQRARVSQGWCQTWNFFGNLTIFVQKRCVGQKGFPFMVITAYFMETYPTTNSAALAKVAGVFAIIGKYRVRYLCKD